MLQVAIRAAFQAGEVLMANLGKLSSDRIDLKKKFDFVTEVDKESERVIIAEIRSAFPDHKFLAEETARDEGGGYRWLIDPLDGTTNYIHGFPIFAVSIALERDGEIVLGVVYDPTRNEIFQAQKGGGAFLNDRQILVSPTIDPAICLLTTGFPFRSKEHLELYQKSFNLLFHQVSGIRRPGAVALDFAYLASGRCDGFWEIGLAPWDVAAGFLLVQEAGGKMTDFSGGDQAIWTGNVVASNGKIHSLILGIVQQVFSGTIDR